MMRMLLCITPLEKKGRLSKTVFDLLLFVATHPPPFLTMKLKRKSILITGVKYSKLPPSRCRRLKLSQACFLIIVLSAVTD